MVYVNQADFVVIALLPATDNPGSCPGGADLAMIDDDPLNPASTIHLTADDPGGTVTEDPGIHQVQIANRTKEVVRQAGPKRMILSSGSSTHSVPKPMSAS